MNVSSKASRTIDKYGGFDEFILYAKPALLEGSDFVEKVRPEIVEKWSEINGKKFNRREIILQRRLQKIEEAVQAKTKELEGTAKD